MGSAGTFKRHAIVKGGKRYVSYGWSTRIGMSGAGYFAPMRFAVAVVLPPDHHDISGGAFNEVAEALHHGLVALGHDSVVTNRLDLDDRRTIVLGGNLLVQYALRPPKNPIFYNLEQLGDDLPWMTMPEFVDLFRRYPHWDYSQANVEYLAAMGLPRPAYVPIGYVPELTRIAPVPEDIDVLFYGALNGRRYAVLRELHERGLRVKWLTGAYGASRDAWIARSKIVLNLHYWEAKIFAIVRVSYLLANKRAVVSEHSADPSLERDLASGIAFADYDELVDRCVELVGDERARRELAERGYEAFAARDQAVILQRALSQDLEAVMRQTAVSDDPGLEDKDHSADLRERQEFTFNLFKHKSAQERDWLLGKVKRNPEDARSVFFLAETYFRMEDFDNARKWCERRVEMGGCDEEVYWAMYRLAESMSNLGEPWPDVQQAYLTAWEFRPTRAEALHAIAFRCRVEQHYGLGYQFAQRAAEIPFPDEDLFVPRYADIYAWRATDEQAVCASWIDKHTEAFTLCRGLLARPELPDPDRQRIATNRDFSVPTMLEAAAPYPEALAQSLHHKSRSSRGHRQPDRRTRPRDHRADHQLVSELLPRRIAGRPLCGTRHRPVRPRPRQTEEALRVSRVRPPQIRRQARPPARAAARADQRTILAAPRRRLAVFRPRELHHPPDRGTGRRTTRVSGGHQLPRRRQTHRRQRRRRLGAPSTRRRPLPTHRWNGKRPSDVRHRTPGPSPRCAKQRPQCERPTWATGRRRRAADRQPRRSALHRHNLTATHGPPCR